MAEIAITPIMMGNALLTLGGTNEYQGHVSSATFTPTGNSPVIWKGLGQNSFSRTPFAAWTLDLEGAQDWETTDALSAYLLANEGEIVTAVLEPVNGGQGFTAQVQITPGAIGGAVDAVAVFTASLGSSKPVATV